MNNQSSPEENTAQQEACSDEMTITGPFEKLGEFLISQNDRIDELEQKVKALEKRLEANTGE